jgi:hypothetical protein
MTDDAVMSHIRHSYLPIPSILSAFRMPFFSRYRYRRELNSSQHLLTTSSGKRTIVVHDPNPFLCRRIFNQEQMKGILSCLPMPEVR